MCGGEEREMFWNDLDRIGDIVGNEFKLFVLGDLNGLTEDRVRADITCAFGVPGRRVVKFCA